MRPELERLQRIEDYLLGDSHPGEGPAWVVQQLLDAELGSDTEAQRLVYRGLYVAGQRQLRHELRLIHARLYGPQPGRWNQWAATGLRAIRTGWLRFRRQS